MLSAGERRSFTANTIYRDPRWRRKALEEALALSPSDAAALKIGDGDRVRLVTSQGATEVLAAISDRMQDGHISLPNGLGLDYPDEAGRRTLDGVAPNELTARHRPRSHRRHAVAQERPGSPGTDLRCPTVKRVPKSP